MTMAAAPRQTSLAGLPCAVAWIGDAWATVARMDRDGDISTSAVHRGAGPEDVYLELVARVVGDAQRVVVMGRTSTRLALERAYVGLYRWPDRLVDVEDSDVVGEEELIERLWALAVPVDGEAG